MAFKQLVDGVHILPGLVNIYLIETPDGLALVDTGFPGSADKTLQALQASGRTPQDIRHIVLTHYHVDHVGGAAALQRASGATVYAHADDAPIIETSTGHRAVRASPGIRNKIIAALITRRIPKVEPTHVDRMIVPGESLPFLDGLTPIHIPGHSAGQVALLWRRTSPVLFVADACVNRRGLQLAVVNEDMELAKRSLAKLAALRFETACFGHGPTITTGADRQFRSTWGSA